MEEAGPLDLMYGDLIDGLMAVADTDKCAFKLGEDVGIDGDVDLDKRVRLAIMEEKPCQPSP